MTDLIWYLGRYYSNILHLPQWNPMKKGGCSAHLDTSVSCIFNNREAVEAYSPMRERNVINLKKFIYFYCVAPPGLRYVFELPRLRSSAWATMCRPSGPKDKKLARLKRLFGNIEDLCGLKVLNTYSRPGGSAQCSPG